MVIKLFLKNSPDTIVVDDHVYEFLINNTRLKSLDFVHNLRKHSSGYAVFQKSWPQKNGNYKVETIYLHRLIGDKFLECSKDIKNPCIMFKNGNRQDYRIENLAWVSRKTVQRHNNNTGNSTGYKGVHKEKKKYVARIYIDSSTSVRIGSYDTAEEAAVAYNNKSIELFGHTRGLNKVRTQALEHAH